MSFLSNTNSVAIPHAPNPELEVVPLRGLASKFLGLLSGENSPKTRTQGPIAGISKAIEVTADVVTTGPDVLPRPEPEAREKCPMGQPSPPQLSLREVCRAAVHDQPVLVNFVLHCE